MALAAHGSALPLYAATGNVRLASDIDMRMGWDDWRALPKDVKGMFSLPIPSATQLWKDIPHWRYLRACWAAAEGKRPNRNLVGDDKLPIGNIWVLRSNSALTHHIGIPLELVIVRNMKVPETSLGETDWGLLGMLHDGRNWFVSDQALDDLNNQTLTLIRANGRRDLNRSWPRMWKLQNRLPGWKRHIPDKFTHYFEL
ncbi:MAG: hypothetical protein H6922_05380 [Pseudomonadaceae bacterium]|nr:hypothetical protein [Pseudomonadaceae bacterium]